MNERAATFSPMHTTRSAVIPHCVAGLERPRGESREQSCVIRFADGKILRLEGRDVPSPNAVLLLFKNRKLKALQERNKSPLDRKQRMLRDLQSRSFAPGRAVSAVASAKPWWEQSGMLKAKPQG